MSMLNEAVAFASLMHEGQTRKMIASPYILHPLEVLTIVAKLLPDDEEAMCAAVLHDTVEDTPVTAGQLEEKFGARVNALVAGDTETQHSEMSSVQSWQLRKEESLKHLRASEDIAVRALWMGDKLANIRSIYSQWRTQGDGVFAHFHAGKDKQKWYYTQIADALRRDFEHTDEYREFTDLIDRIFGEQV